MGRYCSQCGNQVRQGTVYCVSCGAILSEPPSSTIPIFPTINTGLSAPVRREAMFDAQDIKTIRTACRVFNIEVLSFESEKIRIVWDETGSWRLSAEQRGECLQLDERNYMGLHNISDLITAQQRKELRIELPKNYRGALVLESDTGNLLVMDVAVDGRIELKTSIGNIRARNLKTQDIFCADTQGGGMDITNIESARAMQLSSLVRGIQAENMKAGGGFSAACTGGRCLLRNVESAEYFYTTGSIGQIILDTVRSHKIDVEVTASGLVDCRKIYADTSIFISTSTGSVTCDVDDEAANYTVHCHSSHGRSNLPDTSGNGQKTLMVNTSIGNIDVHFKNRGETKKG